MISLFNLVPVTGIRFINSKTKLPVKIRNLIHASNPAIGLKVKRKICL